MTFIDVFTHHSGAGFLSLDLGLSVFPLVTAIGRECSFFVPEMSAIGCAGFFTGREGTRWSQSAVSAWDQRSWVVLRVQTLRSFLAGGEFKRGDREEDKHSWKRQREAALRAYSHELCRAHRCVRRRRRERVFPKRRQRKGEKINPLLL